MTTSTYLQVLTTIIKHRKDGILTEERANELHNLFQELYEKDTPTSLILEVLK